MSLVTKTRLVFLAPLVATAALAGLGEAGRLALRYERAALPLDEWWRWLTAHLVHLGAGHALLNAAGLVLVYLLFAARLRAGEWLLVFAAGVVAIGAGLWLFDDQVAWYVGLSGVLHALFAAGALAELALGVRSARWLLAGLVAKLAWEQLLGPLPLTAESAGGPVIVNAHLYGALGGALACGLIWARNSRRRGGGA